MKIAILGAGFSGLACCWHLLQLNHQVTLFDPLGIGRGTSGIAAGLLHPYAGAHAKYNRFGNEGMAATQELLEVASSALNRPVAARTGIYRIALSQEQKEDYALCASRYPNIQWIEASECQRLFPQILPKEGIFIKEGLTVYSDLYLKGLWEAGRVKGVVFKQESCSRLEELKEYDAIILAAGVLAKQFAESHFLPLHSVKGQILQLVWPSHLLPLAVPVNSLGYLVMSEDRKTCFAGATYERGVFHEGVDQEAAMREILPKIEEFFPEIRTMEVIDCRVGMRASTPDHLPICKQITDKCWVLAGMGSKGLLYHALMAKSLASLINF